MNGIRVGAWKVTPSSGHEFAYDEAWIGHPEARPISLSMALRPHEPYRGEQVSNYFENLLPDNRRIRERLQQRFRTSSVRAFDLLAEVGRECIGAIQLLPAGEAPPSVQRIDSVPLEDRDVENHLTRLIADGRHVDEAQGDDFRMSLAGAQEKTALLRLGTRWHLPRGATPTTHILKLPLGVSRAGIDLSTSVENEWLCSQLLGEFGVDAAACEMARFGTMKVLVVERFDRKFAPGNRWIMRLPQEDFAQVAGIPPELKYESDGGPGIRWIMDHLRGSENAEADRIRFMRTQWIFWLLAAIDGHAKNFSVFIRAGGRFLSTPGYDVLSAYPLMGRGASKLAPEKVRMSMAVWGSNRHYRWADIRRPHFLATARDCGLGNVAESLIDETIARAPNAVDAVGARLPRGFPASVADSIFEGVIQAAKRLGA